MQSLGGMAQFVANGWAGKDYTHINFAGGRRVAWALYDAINRGAMRLSGGTARLYGIDRDGEAIAAASARLGARCV